jgi:hypothetical protein
VVGLLDVPELNSVLGLLDELELNRLLGLLGPGVLLVLGVPRLVGLLPLPARPVEDVAPRGRVGPPPVLCLLNPVGVVDPVGPLRAGGEVVPVVDPRSGIGVVTIGVRVELREPPSDEAGAQLTPGVVIDDWGVALVALVADLVVEPVPVVPLLPVVPELPVVCANAGAPLKAIAHARPAPLRIGIFMALIRMLILIRTCLLS